MQQIQITRGKLEVRAHHSNLLNGELFLDYTHGEKYDQSNNTYELYAGCNGKAIKIGGQGVLSFVRALGEREGLPENPIYGGIYYVTHDIDLSDSSNDVGGKELPEFRKGDLAIYVGEKYYQDNSPNTEPDLETAFRANGIFQEPYKGWIRISNGGGTSYEVTFDPINTNFSSDTTNVQAALVELDRNKLGFGGVKFKKDVASGEKDLLGEPIIPVTSETGSLTVNDLVGKGIKAGYYYSVGALDGQVTIQIGDGENDVITLEEGDFLAVTSDVTTNNVPLTADNLKLEKIAGGTHDSEKIKYTVSGRHSTYENSTDKAWDTEDGAVDNVKAALDDLFKSKADLNTNGKIPLTQLPDTLLQSMEFAGAFILEPPEEGEFEFHLPTKKDKTHVDESSEGEELRQGDYFIYTGPMVDLTEEKYSGLHIKSSEKRITSGDWLVFEGDGNWSVIDNTSPIQSIKVNETDGVNNPRALMGEVTFEGNSRIHGDTEITETQLTVKRDDGRETIVISNKNSALISDDDIGQAGKIYKEGGDKTLVKSGLEETVDGQLVIKEAKGLEIVGDVVAERGVVSKNSNGENADTVDEGQELHVDIIQNPAQKEFGHTELKLPAQSGTIARLEDIGLNGGNDFFIPRYKENPATREISLTNSPIELIDHTGNVGESPSIMGITFHEATGEMGLQKKNSLIFRAGITPKSGTDGEAEILNIMPGTSGYILNSNSIIDCGEWTADGELKFEHEGSYSTYHNGSLSTTSPLYRELILANDKLDIDSNDIIDAYITND